MDCQSSFPHSFPSRETLTVENDQKQLGIFAYKVQNDHQICLEIFGSIVSGYHADTPITIKVEASSKADSRPN